MSGRCSRHLGSLLVGARRKVTATSLDAARNTLESASRKRWAYPPEYNIVRCRTEEILQDSRPGSDLVVLDDEFSPASEELWEFALIEYVSGNKLISTTVKQQGGNDHHIPGDDPFLRFISRAKARSVYALFRYSRIDYMEVRGIASAFQRLRTSQDTIFIVYHTSKTDLQMLRKLLVSKRHDHILPPDKNCVPIIN